MEGNDDDHTAPSEQPNRHRRWWDKQSEAIKIAYIGGGFALIVALIGIIPNLNFGTKTLDADVKPKVSIESSEFAIGNIEGDVIINSDNVSKPETFSSRQRGKTTRDATKVLSKDIPVTEESIQPDSKISEKDGFLPKRITPEKLSDLFLNAGHWTSETDITNLYRGKKIPEPGWNGIVQTFPKKSVISGYQMEVSDESSKAMFDISFADDPSQFVPGDMVIFVGSISTLYQTSPPGNVWIHVKASMVKPAP